MPEVTGPAAAHGTISLTHAAPAAAAGTFGWPATLAAGGGCLCFVGCCFAFKKTHLKRESKKNLAKQSIEAGAAQFVDDKDENGNPIKVLLAAPRGCNWSLKKSPGGKDPDKDKDLVVSLDGNTTLFDAIVGSTKFADKPCYGTCVQPHTYKDAMMPDGTPNKKPMVVETPGKWEWKTYKEVRKTAQAFGSRLRSAYGIKETEKIAIWAGNRVEWMITDLACHGFNWTSVSVYDTLGPNAASYICADAGCSVLVCEAKTFLKVPAMMKDAYYKDNPGKNLKVVIVMGPFGKDEETKVATVTKELEGLGLKVETYEKAIEEFSEKPMPWTKPKPEDLATIMYTSGTTGMPKGVKLTHRNVSSTIAAFLAFSEPLTDTDKHLSYLPLAHIFEREMEYGFLTGGACVAFASNGAKALLADLGVVKPTVFAGVPKVYENVRDAVVRKMTGRKKTLFDKAMKAKIADIETGCGYPQIYDTLIFNKTKKALGGKVRFCISGGAPISKETLQFVLCALGPIAQGYGATETAAASTMCNFWDLNMGHVGPPLPHTNVRLVDVPEMNYFAGQESDYKNAAGSPGAAAFAANKAKKGGEVWIRGHGVSPGYYDPSVDDKTRSLPSNGMSKKTKEDFFVENGVNVFKTGDIGYWVEELDCLKIVDRRKNMFKTQFGEYVPVEEVEKTYQDACQYIDFVFLPKETKVAYVALCVIVSDSMSTVKRWAADQKELAGKSDKEICESPQFKKLLMEEFGKAAKAKKLASFLSIQKEANLHVDYQPIGYQEQWVEGVKCANGHTEQLLTATFKARRAQLDQYYAPVFPKIYPDRPADHVLP